MSTREGGRRGLRLDRPPAAPLAHGAALTSLTQQMRLAWPLAPERWPDRAPGVRRPRIPAHLEHAALRAGATGCAARARPGPSSGRSPTRESRAPSVGNHASTRGERSSDPARPVVGQAHRPLCTPHAVRQSRYRAACRGEGQGAHHGCGSGIARPERTANAARHLSEVSALPTHRLRGRPSAELLPQIRGPGALRADAHHRPQSVPGPALVTVPRLDGLRWRAGSCQEG